MCLTWDHFYEHRRLHLKYLTKSHCCRQHDRHFQFLLYQIHTLEVHIWINHLCAHELTFYLSKIPVRNGRWNMLGAGKILVLGWMTGSAGSITVLSTFSLKNRITQLSGKHCCSVRSISSIGLGSVSMC